MAQFSKRPCKIENLKLLWETVFGDTRVVTDAFFENAFFPDGCFYAALDGKVVSAFYLLPVTYQSCKGFYLYAAATLPDYRGRGLMGQLIKEALAFAGAHADFVYLCPAEESLYGYYSRFGFTQTLYAKFVSESDDTAVADAREMYELAKKMSSAPLFLPGVYRYAASIGCKMYKQGGTQFGEKYVYAKDSLSGETAAYGMLAPLCDKVDTANLFAFFTMN